MKLDTGSNNGGSSCPASGFIVDTRIFVFYIVKPIWKPARGSISPRMTLRDFVLMVPRPPLPLAGTSGLRDSDNGLVA